MDLFFETENGSTFSIEVGYFDTVFVKKKIEKYQRIPVSKQTLFFQGDCPLQDDHDIKKCKIFNITLILSWRLIYGQDLPLTTEHFLNIQRFYGDEIPPVTVGGKKNSNQMLQTEKSPPLKSAEQIINDQDLPVTAQKLQSEQSPLSNSFKDIVKLQDSPAKGRSNEKNDQERQTKESSPLNTVKEIVNLQESPVKLSFFQKVSCFLQTFCFPFLQNVGITDQEVELKLGNLTSCRKQGSSFTLGFVHSPEKKKAFRSGDKDEIYQ
ncbi:hypothetical protein EUTSA_v10029479mg [Eutrema salsugineum]|uniref:Ubiquitin-like domain-containing protein n=1 Tax=Eutrema salsugineum TaxID=72664 RepID=V4MZL2_EUTSA|nr:hypothetical protein EUTSA_v10029479mg [Eutrema salsugineum]